MAAVKLPSDPPPVLQPGERRFTKLQRARLLEEGCNLPLCRARPVFYLEMLASLHTRLEEHALSGIDDLLPAAPGRMGHPGCHETMRRIMVRHILPHALGPIIVAASRGVADAIISESGLSFLGLGIQPPTASWGNMLKNALDQILAAPWTAIVPGFMIFLTVLSINYIGDGLRDAFNPRKIL
jgi:hypothetical protein